VAGFFADSAVFLGADGSVQEGRESIQAELTAAMAGSPTCPANVRPGTVSLAMIGTGTPLWSATVPAEYDFQTWFVWPLIKGLTGSDAWTVRTQVTYQVIRWAQ